MFIPLDFMLTTFDIVSIFLVLDQGDPVSPAFLLIDINLLYGITNH